MMHGFDQLCKGLWKSSDPLPHPRVIRFSKSVNEGSLIADNLNGQIGSFREESNPAGPRTLVWSTDVRACPMRAVRPARDFLKTRFAHRENRDSFNNPPALQRSVFNQAAMQANGS